MGFAERNVKPFRTGFDASSVILRIGCPLSRSSQQDLTREYSSPSGFLPRFLSRSNLSILFSATARSLRIMSSSSFRKSCSEGGVVPSSPLKFLTTCSSASHMRTWFQMPLSDFEGDEDGISEGSRYSIFACVVFLGLYISLKKSTRSSYTMIVAILVSVRDDPGVSLSLRAPVRAEKTVDLPDCGRPIMPNFIVQTSVPRLLTPTLHKF